MKKLLLLISLLLATNASAHSGDTGEHTHIFSLSAICLPTVDFPHPLVPTTLILIPTQW